jgi:hypothetical protein
MSPMLFYENFKTQQEELIRQADHERLVKQALASQPRALDRIQARTGKLLLRIGRRLQTYSKPRSGVLDEEGQG